MKREVFVCALIFAYCLVVGFFTLRPQLIMADQSAEVISTEAVPIVHFQPLPDSPDPNQVFDLVNKERVTQGSPALTGNDKLARVALNRAKDMAQRQYYAHKSPDNKYYYDLFPENNIKVDYSCENLDMVFVPDINMFIDEWLASTKGHRDCMLNPDLKQAGYAVTKMMLVEYGGKQVPAYLVVAIHATQLR